MKKSYLQPETCIENLHLESQLLIKISGSTVEGDDGGWVKEENNTWDIWGENEAE